ncbi:RCC1 domain-containing protein, partial [Verrucomicrobium spinosum]|uniref:RCC1 domain-containing protein n=1 Tax=Verrucomicrobium spinosum TaxID=2736 RepID=UPI003CCCC6D1
MGYNHTVVAKTDGTVWSYGLNSLGQLGVTAGASQLTPVQVTALSDAKAVAVGYDFSLVLKTDGTVWGFGSNTNGTLGDGTFVSSRATPAQVSGTVDITAVAAGRGHSALLKSDGTVWTFGGNTYGQLGDGTTTSRYAPVQATGLTGAVAVAAG